MPHLLRDTATVTESPCAAVVVSTYNRAHLLPRLVDAIARQTGVGPFELVIVNDGSTDDTDAVLDELARRGSAAVHVVRSPSNRGPAHGRNLGWRAAGAPLIVFTDDDCVPEPEWLAALVDGLGTADVVQGPTLPDPIQAAGRGPFARLMWVERWSDQFETCNVGYRRAVLEQLDGFDESFRRPFGEDVDLGWRAIDLGVSTRWVDAAVVRHDVVHSGRLRDFIDTVKDTRRKVFTALMVRRHPGIRRRLLFARIFYRDSHVVTIVALIGFALLALRPGQASRWWALLLLLPYVMFRAFLRPSIARRRHLPIVIPMEFVVDAAEVGVMLVSSARFRRLVL